MFNLGMSEIVLILVVALVFLGPRKLPELASGLGKMLRELRKATADIKNEIELDEMIRKPLEELREAAYLPPEELKRRDLERALRKKEEKEEAARLAKMTDEERRLEAEGRHADYHADHPDHHGHDEHSYGEHHGDDMHSYQDHADHSLPTGDDNVVGAPAEDRTLAMANPFAPVAPPPPPAPPLPSGPTVEETLFGTPPMKEVAPNGTADTMMAKPVPRPAPRPPVGSVPRTTLFGVGSPPAGAPRTTPAASLPAVKPPAVAATGAAAPGAPKLPPPGAPRLPPPPSAPAKKA